MTTNWKKVSPAVFEKLCAALLRYSNFKNIQWYGEAGSDKGRDILAEKVDRPLRGIERRERWLIQCKRYTARRISKGDLKDLFDAALEHDVHNVLVILAGKASANVRDWIKAAEKRYPFGLFLWEEADVSRELYKNRVRLLNDVPEIHAGQEPVAMYPMSPRTINFGSNEFEEVEIHVMNVDDVKEAELRATEFLTYVRENGFDWWR